MTGFLALISLVFLAQSAAPAENKCAAWRSIDAESELYFIPTFEGAEAPGRFRRFDVCLDFDPRQPEQGRLEVRIDITSADMDSADLNEEIATPEWFDAGAFPRARFLSETIEISGQASYLATGTLSLKGIEHRVDVPFTWEAVGGNAAMRGELTLLRTTFGIGSGEWAEDESDRP